MSPNLTVFLVVLAFMAASCAASYGLGKLRPARRVVDEVAADVHEAHRAAWPCWCWEDEDDEMAEMRDLPEADLVRPEPDRILLHQSEDAGARVHQREALPSPVRVAVERAASVGLPSQDTYRAELAKLAGPDPAPWLAALIAPDPPPDPGPKPEPAWLEHLLYRGAISTAWCESVLNDHAEWRHAEEAATDRAIARWVEESWWVLIGARQWPHPDLVSAT